MKDEKLFELFASGDKGKLDILIARYQQSLYGYLVRYTGDYILAEEVVQDTFIKIFNKHKLYSKGKPFKPWLYQIAINTAKDKLRQKNSQPPTLTINKDEPMSKTVDSPEHDLHCKEIGEMINKAVSKLPETQRQVFILREYEKMSYKDISVAVERPINTVKSDMHRAIKALRILLDQLTAIAMKGELI